MAQRVERLSVSVLCTIITLVPETALVSLRTLAFFLPLVTYSFSSFNATSYRFLTIALFRFPVSGGKVSQSEFLIFSSFHHRFQFLIIGHRYLLMNLHLVQFSNCFELIRLTYPQFVDTFQDIIRWYL